MHHFKKKNLSIIIALLGVTTPFCAMADTEVENLETLYVNSNYERPDAQYLNSEDIKKLPTSNGNITELLKTNPNVSFGASSNSGYAAGEIAPADISFHGQPFYNNNFTVDGLSNNDTMNPGSSNGAGMDYSSTVNSSSNSIPPGDPQAFYVDSSLVDKLAVYDSNVPAKYGSFTGGVVDADLKDPSPLAPSGSISFRTTRDNWTHLHEDDDTEDPINGDATNENSGEPEFTKRIYHVDLNQPLSEKAAVMFSYDRTESKIPKDQPLLGTKENERRLSETYLLKGLWDVTDDDKLVASVMWSPHKGKYIPTNSTRNGNMWISGGGWQGFIDWSHEFDKAKVDTKIAYQQTTNQREWADDSGFIQHQYPSDSLGWCSSMTSSGTCTAAREGGYPTDKTKNTTWTLKQDWSIDPIDLGPTQHQFDFGWQVDIAKAEYEREGDHVTYYSSPSSRTGFDLSNCFDCDRDAGWSFVEKIVYPKADASVNVNTYGVYAQDVIKAGPVTLTPGFRVDHDQFLGNTNFSPRFAVKLDVLKNSTSLFGGVNRYYAGNMLYYALRSALPKGTQYGATSGSNMRKPDQAWEDAYQKETSSPSIYKNITDLKTPYSDEWDVGLAQKFGNNNLTLKYVYRKGKNLFKQADNDDGYELTNDGWTKSKTLSLEVGSTEPYKFGAFELGYRFGAKYFDTKNNNRYAYDDLSFEDQYDWKAIVDGKLLNPNEIPAMDFNQKWATYLELDTAIPDWGLTWTHRLTFADGYRAYEAKSVNCGGSNPNPACGSYTGRAYEYTRRDFKDYVTWDWRINWAIPMGGQRKLDLTLDVLNVLDTKVGSNVGSSVNGSTTTVSGYEVGRQFWLGAAYRW